MENVCAAMPSPFELANENKNSTVTMSLRIKRTTKDFFEEQARLLSNDSDSEASEDSKEKGSKTTASFLMNSVLDKYAKFYIQQAEKKPVTTVLRPYLEKMAAKVATMDGESLIHRMFRPGREATMKATFTDTDPAHIIRTWRDTIDGEQNSEYEDAELRYPLMQSSLDLDISALPAASKEQDASITSVQDNWRYEISMGLAKWPIVAAMADSYARKIQELTGQTDEEFTFSADKFQEMVSVINSTDDKKELATKLAEFFASYAEEIYE